jgi:hypothetical protein
MKTINALFTSVWDGCEEVTTTCKINTETGEITDIESVDVDNEYEVLSSEYVSLSDGRMFDVESNDDGEYFLSDTDLIILNKK